MASYYKTAGSREFASQHLFNKVKEVTQRSINKRSVSKLIRTPGGFQQHLVKLEDCIRNLLRLLYNPYFYIAFMVYNVLSDLSIHLAENRSEIKERV